VKISKLVAGFIESVAAVQFAEKLAKWKSIRQWDDFLICGVQFGGQRYCRRERCKIIHLSGRTESVRHVEQHCCCGLFEENIFLFPRLMYQVFPKLCACRLFTDTLPGPFIFLLPSSLLSKNKRLRYAEL
jgi:hypothetical protein